MFKNEKEKNTKKTEKIPSLTHTHKQITLTIKQVKKKNVYSFATKVRLRKSHLPYWKDNRHTNVI